MKKSLLLIVFVVLTCLSAQAEQKTVNLTAAGQLSSQIVANEKYSITELTVIGPLNGADLAFIRDMAGKDAEGENTEGQLKILDLSEATIVDGGIYYTNMQTTKEYTADANVIGDYMFCNLNLTQVALPASTEKLGYRAFYNCPYLTTVTGTETVTNLSDAVFESCSVLDGVVLNAELTMIPNALFKRCSALNNFAFPATITTIGEEAFYNCKLTSLNFPEGLVTIGKNAFESIGATSLTLPSGIKELSDYAFYSCNDLAEIYLNDGLERLGEGALAYNRAATKLVIPQTVTTIGKSAFACCSKLREVVLPEGIDTIPAYCFDRSSALTTVNIPQSVTLIDEYAFQTCGSLTDVVLPEGLKEVGERSFVDCESITELLLPSTLTTIGSEAFSGTGISEIVIPEGVTRLGGEGGIWMPGGSVFAWCMNLTKVELPSTIEALGTWTFSACPLEELAIHAVTPPNIVGFQNNPFEDNHYETCIVIVPVGSLDNYKNDEDGWALFQNIKEETTTGIVAADAHSASPQQAYTLDGQHTSATAKGIVIVNHRKVFNK